MPAVSGIDFMVKVNTGTDETPVWTAVAGQRGATLKLDGEGIDTTSKDSDGWNEEIPGFNSWGIDFDGLFIEGDAGYAALETAWIQRKLVKVEMVLPSGKFYTGAARVSLQIDGPYKGEATVSGTLSGSGALTPPVA